jgi:hypothetical protein
VFLWFYWFFSTKEKFASVGIKENHIWSHNQGDRLNYITNLFLGKTRWNIALNLLWQQRFQLLYIRRLLTHPSAAYTPVGCLCTRQLLVYLSAAYTADHLPIHSSLFVRRDRRHTQRNTKPQNSTVITVTT